MAEIKYTARMALTDIINGTNPDKVTAWAKNEIDKLDKKNAKAKAEAEKKARKIERDKAHREQRAKAKAEHDAKKGEG